MPPSPDSDELASGLFHQTTRAPGTRAVDAEYGRIFEAISDGLILNDLETGRVVEANPAAGAMHGYTREEFIGLHPSTYMHPNSYHLFGEHARAVHLGDNFEALALHMRRNGSPFTVEVRGMSFTYRGRLSMLGVVRDVSERIEAERLLQQRQEASSLEQSMLATLQERQRLAQNLHDAVNQSLFSASLIAEVLPRLWERDPDEGRRSLEDLRRLTRGAMAEMRGLLVELRPLVLTDSEPGDLLRQLGSALTGRTNVPVALTVMGQGVLPADVQVAFYRICQEALNNIAKHASADQVKIHLQYDAGTVELHIRDDGRGFDPDRAPSGHSGLSIMRERAKAIGAALSVVSQPGHGAEIIIRWTEDSEERTL
jgi:PAS domain S-box-containing protein